MPGMIPLTAEDRRVLALGREQGIGDGFTVPANVPGEALGSCSFANEAGRPMRDEMLTLAQLAGAFAFEGARRLWSTRAPIATPTPPMRPHRQRDAVPWAARRQGDGGVRR